MLTLLRCGEISVFDGLLAKYLDRTGHFAGLVGGVVAWDFRSGVALRQPGHGDGHGFDGANYGSGDQIGEDDTDQRGPRR
jgi:hypothetical protein